MASPPPDGPEGRPPPPYQDPHGDPPPEQSYERRSHYEPVQQQRTAGSAIAALICGIIALLISWIPVVNLLSFILGLVAIGTGIAGISKANKPGFTGKGLAIGGLVTGILALVIAVLLYVGLVNFAQSPQFQEQLEQIQDQITPTP